jgi:hypothetical protein
MLTIRVDFNALDSGLVRGRVYGNVDGAELVTGRLVLLDDGEGSEALGTIEELRDGLVFAAVEWGTFGPAGIISPVSLTPPAYPKRVMFAITGSVWRDLVGERASERINGAAELFAAA